MPYTDDPVKDYEQYDKEQAKRLEKLPVCDCCCDHIQDDHYYQTECEILCPHCLETYYRREIDDE